MKKLDLIAVVLHQDVAFLQRPEPCDILELAFRDGCLQRRALALIFWLEKNFDIVERVARPAVFFLKSCQDFSAPIL